MLPRTRYLKLFIGLAAGLVLMGVVACGADEDAEAPAAPQAAAAAAPAGAAPATAPGAAAAAAPAPAAAAAPAATAVPVAVLAPEESMEAVPKSGGILIFSATEDTGINNPILTQAQFQIKHQTSDPLVKLDVFGDLEGRLAESWSVSADNKTVTFNLRRGVKWSDGAPFTSADVLFSFDMIGNPEVSSALDGNLKVGGEYITYSAPDDFTVQVTTARPHSPIIVGISEALIIPEHVLEGVDDINVDPFNTAPVLTGAMKVVEYKRAEFLRTVKNVDYYMGEPFLDGVTHAFFTEWDAGLAAVLAGESDGAYAIPQDQPQFERASDSTVYVFPYWHALTLSFNQAHPALAEKAVRQAFSLSIRDKDEWAKTVLRGRGSSAFAFFTPGAPVARFNPTQDKMPHEFNLDKARTVLADAGWVIGDSGLYEKTIDGVVEKLELPLPWQLDEYGEGTQILDSYMNELGGIKVLIRNVDRGLRTDLRNEAPTRFRERSMEIWEWPHAMGNTGAGKFDPDYTSDLHSASIPPLGSNNESYRNSEVDALLEAGTATFDISERQAIYSQVQQLVLQDFASIPIYHAFDALAASSRVKGITEDTPMSMHFFRSFIHKFWLEN